MGLFDIFKKKEPDTITSVGVRYAGDWVTCESPTEHDVDYAIISINGHRYTYDSKTNLVDFDEEEHQEGKIFLKNGEVTIAEEDGEHSSYDFGLGFLKRDFYLCDEYIEKKDESHSPDNVVYIGKNNTKNKYTELILKDGTCRRILRIKTGSYKNETVQDGTYVYDSRSKRYLCTIPLNLTAKQLAEHKYQDILGYSRFAVFIEPDGTVWSTEYVEKSHMTDFLYPELKEK